MRRVLRCRLGDVCVWLVTVTSLIALLRKVACLEDEVDRESTNLGRQKQRLSGDVHPFLCASEGIRGAASGAGQEESFRCVFQLILGLHWHYPEHHQLATATCLSYYLGVSSNASGVMPTSFSFSQESLARLQGAKSDADLTRPRPIH